MNATGRPPRTGSGAAPWLRTADGGYGNARISRFFGRILELPRICGPHPESFGIPSEVGAGAMKAMADRVFGPHRQVAGPEAPERLLFGWAPDQLREYAKPLGAEAVVVGRRGKTGRGLHHLWSVAVTRAMKGPFTTLIV